MSAEHGGQNGMERQRDKQKAGETQRSTGAQCEECAGQQALKIMEALSGVDEELLERCMQEERGEPWNKGLLPRSVGSFWRARPWAAVLCLAAAGAAVLGGYGLSGGGPANLSGTSPDGEAGARGVPALEAEVDGEAGALAQDQLSGQEAGAGGGCFVEEEYSLEEARALEGLGDYIPGSLPEGYAFERAVLYSEEEGESLTVFWSRGKEQLTLKILRHDSDILQIGTEWADPVYAQEDLSLEAVEGSMALSSDTGGTDTGGTDILEGKFSVLYPEGYLVWFDGRGTAEEIWDMFCSIEGSTP